MTTKSSTPSLGSPTNHKDRGFTLIELLIVIVILGVLAGITVFAVQNFTSTSVQAACKADYKSVEVAVEAYKAQTGQYPTTGSHGIPAALLPPDPTSDAVTTTNGFLSGDGSDSPTLGPWLRDQPTNGTHYRIEVPLNVASNGTGHVEVWNSTGTATIPAVSTNSAADCGSVK